MKTLVINGSPRKNGDSMNLVNEMTKYLDGEVKIINPYYDNITPCIDCRYCWRHDGCKIDDEMQNVYKLINKADNVIISSPLYFSELTGKLLSFASRLQCYFIARGIREDKNFKLKRKNGVLIITGGGDGSPERAIASTKIIFRHINTKLIGDVLSLKTNNIPTKEDIKALQKAQNIALKLNELYKLS